MLQALPLVFALAGLTLYTVLAGADFGAGLWQLFAGRGERGEQIREHARHSVGPVWEANHVWLIFVLTVTWTAYPRVFGSVASTLAVPLFIAAIGIIFRGAAYALRAGAASAREAGVIDTIFSVSSILTPFALGAAIGAIATDRVPVGNAAGHEFSSWLNATSVFVGVLAVTSSAYLAAVYLAADAARHRHDELARRFRTRALAAGVVAGVVAIAGLFVVHGHDHGLTHSLLRGDAIPAVIVSLLAGGGTLALVYVRRFEAARYGAALAVAAIVAGWALSRWPEILPGLTVDRAAAGHDTLVWVIVAVLAGGAILFPSLALLFRLTLTGRLGGESGAGESGGGEPGSASAASAASASGATPTAGAASAAVLTGALPRVPYRVPLACLIAGIGLLNAADARWAHAIGVVCLIAFVASGFLALVGTALADHPE